MDSGSLDSVARLKNAEDEATAKVESARKDSEGMVKRSRAKAAAIVDAAIKEAQDTRRQMTESSRAKIKGEFDDAISKANSEAERIKTGGLEPELVSKSLKSFLGGLGV